MQDFRKRLTEFLINYNSINIEDITFDSWKLSQSVKWLTTGCVMIPEGGTVSFLHHILRALQDSQLADSRRHFPQR
jgi:hypothetical protein